MHSSFRILLSLSLVLILIGLPSRGLVVASSRVLPGFPLLRQHHPLTCEAAATSMATQARILEGQIMAALPRNPNPNLGFRGNPDGEQGTKLIDYGVYAAPIHQVLIQDGYQSDVLMYAPDAELKAYIDRGWPVVVWVTYALQHADPRLEWSNGTQFFLVPHEHAVLVVGYDGTSVFVNDPFRATRERYNWSNFNRAWGYFARMGLAVEPCPVPEPVSHLRPVAVSDQSITWAWRPAVNAWGYRVRVTQHNGHSQVVYTGTIQDHRFTLATIVPGAGYEIAVSSLSACGAASAVSRVWTYPPPPTATPTATPMEATLTPPTSTATATPSPTARPTATATPTHKP